MSKRSERQLRVFFSYSFRDAHWLRPIFRNTCENLRVQPVFAEEIMKPGDIILQKLRQLMLSSDIMVAVVTRSFSPAVFGELEYFRAINKPISLLVFKPLILRQIEFRFRGFDSVLYKNENELVKVLSSALSRFKSTLKTPDYVHFRREQNKIIDLLKESLEKNVLILGKDSDEEGQQKIEQISYVVKRRGYEPVKLKDLSEIEHLSLEDKMIRIGGLCRFVIAEDSRPSGHIDEIRLCANCQYVTATVREVGTASSWMQAHYPIQYNFMNRFCYKSENAQINRKDRLCDNLFDSLEIATDEAITWAENRINEQEKKFKRNIYSDF